jgi:hypothetical protein
MHCERRRWRGLWRLTEAGIKLAQALFREVESRPDLRERLKAIYQTRLNPRDRHAFRKVPPPNREEFYQDCMDERVRPGGRLGACSAEPFRALTQN